jgi:hypothetical protein
MLYLKFSSVAAEPPLLVRYRKRQYAPDRVRDERSIKAAAEQVRSLPAVETKTNKLKSVKGFYGRF